MLKSFNLTVSPDGSLNAGLDVDAAEGVADSGNFTEDLTDLLVALGEAARARHTGVVFLFDEVQFLDGLQLAALIAALHRTVQRNLPITLVGAGLPHIRRLAGEAKSYAEGLFKFVTIGELSESAGIEALVVPAERLGIAYADDAAHAILDYTQGYPCLLQQYGHTIWDESPGSPIRPADVVAVQPLVEANLDGSFFGVRAERPTELELQYLRAMAHLGPQPQKASDVAEVLKRTSAQLGPTRSRLIEKGLLYTPGYGLAAFTVPQFDRHLIRNHELVITPAKPRGGLRP